MKKSCIIFPAFCPTACSVSWVKSEAPPPSPGSLPWRLPVADNTTTSVNSTNDNTTATLMNNTPAYAPQGEEEEEENEEERFEDESFNEEYLIGAIKVEFTKAGVYSFSYFHQTDIG